MGTSLPPSNGGNIPALPCSWDMRTEYTGDAKARGHQLERVWGASWKGEVAYTEMMAEKQRLRLEQELQ